MLVKNIIFNSNVIKQEEKDVINQYLDAELDTDNDYELYIYDENKEKYIYDTYEVCLDDFDYFMDENFVLVESLYDFNKIIKSIHECW